MGAPLPLPGHDRDRYAPSDTTPPSPTTHRPYPLDVSVPLYGTTRGPSPLSSLGGSSAPPGAGAPGPPCQPNVAARKAFNGTKIDNKRDLGLKFGQYCEVYEQLFVINTMAPRTRPAIVLLPKRNKQGLWQFMALDTFRVIVRDHWTKLPMSEWTIRKLNEKTAANKKLVPDDPLLSLGKAEITFENSGVNSTLLP